MRACRGRHLQLRPMVKVILWMLLQSSYDARSSQVDVNALNGSKMFLGFAVIIGILSYKVAAFTTPGFVTELNDTGFLNMPGSSENSTDPPDINSTVALRPTALGGSAEHLTNSTTSPPDSAATTNLSSIELFEDQSTDFMLNSNASSSDTNDTVYLDFNVTMEDYGYYMETTEIVEEVDEIEEYDADKMNATEESMEESNATIPCEPSPCYPGGSCHRLGNSSFYCLCMSRYSGKHCTIDKYIVLLGISQTSQNDIEKKMERTDSLIKVMTVAFTTQASIFLSVLTLWVCRFLQKPVRNLAQIRREEQSKTFMWMKADKRSHRLVYSPPSPKSKVSLTVPSIMLFPPEEDFVQLNGGEAVAGEETI